MLKLLEAFSRNERGSFGIMFALSAIPLILVMGIGIDTYTEISYKARYDAAADAASVAAAQTAQRYMTDNAASQSGTALLNNAIAAGVAQAAKVFAANSGTAATEVPVGPTFDLVKNGTHLTATTTYSGSVKLSFGPLIGLNQGHITGSSAASLAFATYVNYYILVDTSGSMGIADTQAEMSRLRTLTASSNDGGSCVFACHGHYNTGDPTLDNEGIAHSASPPVILRIDSAKTAIQTMITQARNTIGNNGNIKFGLYTMELNGATGTYIRKIADPSSDYNTLSVATAGIDLPLFINNNSNVPGWSDLKDAVNTLAAIVPANGNGLSSATPINYAFIVTDGLQDTPGSCDGNGHCVAPIDLSSCHALQVKATVGTIYTTYLPIYNGNNSAYGYDSFYRDEVLPYAPQLAPNMQNCASNPSLYFQADDGPTLISSMQKLFAATNQPVALSQ